MTTQNRPPGGDWTRHTVECALSQTVKIGPATNFRAKMPTTKATRTTTNALLRVLMLIAILTRMHEGRSIWQHTRQRDSRELWDRGAYGAPAHASLRFLSCSVWRGERKRPPPP